ncbi:acyl-CoA thioesterase II [uncultured Sulfitobacter sp.]|mgnify:FL=1|jgi:acyl-CoA thioesterase-2|uniref:acyl-CoA thioesterase n=1 Tax=uncultured Sulfitobacter sp. TaxID=191468 RepID=UPI0030D8B6CC|tara:strand:- start:88079 stop:88951 length:873 start_codon:yes stop_codon:yes gene_type:complete
MTDVARQLLELLDIEQLEVDLFRGIGSGGETTTRIFGGHVIAQALMAAYRTVPDRMCHSLHAYFIRPGDPSIPVIYQVDRARDGGSFTTRRVVAIQHGKQIFNLSASFHVEEDGWDYQHQMPDVKGPEHWLDRPDLREPYIQKIPEKHRDDFLRERPIEIREVDPRDLFEPEKTSDKNYLWFRMEAAKGQSPIMQQCLLAYASDMNLLGSSLRPHGLTWFQGKVMTASLDHAMWFHAPIDFSDWHLYELDAPFTGGARGFNRGLIYNQNGQLAASTAQEGLMRPYKKKET